MGKTAKLLSVALVTAGFIAGASDAALANCGGPEEEVQKQRTYARNMAADFNASKIGEAAQAAGLGAFTARVAARCPKSPYAVDFMLAENVSADDLSRFVQTQGLTADMPLSSPGGCIIAAARALASDVLIKAGRCHKGLAPMPE